MGCRAMRVRIIGCEMTRIVSDTITKLGYWSALDGIPEDRRLFAVLMGDT